MNLESITVLSNLAGRPVGELKQVAEKYPFAISPFLSDRVKNGTYSLAAARQYLPDARELLDVSGFVGDPTGEAGLHPEQSVLQTYSNRVALMVTHQCLVYCRFCFRKDFVGYPQNHISDADLQKAVAFIAARPEINDVLLSGGDALALPNRRLIPLLHALMEIPHLKAIRIHSRALSAHPKRLDDELLECLKTDDRFWYYAHMNHPDDLNHPEVIATVRRLLSARVPVLNQCVILAGVNDDPETMYRLMKLCYENKVLPYNLYVLDRVKGAGHFEVPVERIVEIYKALSDLPGPAQPVLVYVDSKSRKHRAVYSESINLSEFLGQR